MSPTEIDRENKRIAAVLSAYEEDDGEESERAKSNDSFTKDYNIPLKVLEVEKQLKFADIKNGSPMKGGKSPLKPRSMIENLMAGNRSGSKSAIKDKQRETLERLK